MADILATVRDRVETRLNAGKPVASASDAKLDPSIWLAIFDAVAEMLKECLAKKNDKATLAATIQKPTLMQQLLLRRAVVKELGRADFKKLGADVVTHLVDVAHTSTLDEATAFVDEISE